MCFLCQVSVEELKSGAGAGWRISCDPGQPFCTLLLGPFQLLHLLLSIILSTSISVSINVASIIIIVISIISSIIITGPRPALGRLDLKN